MIDLLKFFDNNGKTAIWIGEIIHGLYSYLDIILSLNNLTSSVHIYHPIGKSFSSNNCTDCLRLVIADLYVRQNIICELCGIIGHEAESWIIHGPKFLPPNLSRKINQYNSLHGDEPTEPPIECNIQPPSVNFKYHTSPTKSIPVFLTLTVRINLCVINNFDIEVYTSDYIF